MLVARDGGYSRATSQWVRRLGCALRGLQKKQNKPSWCPPHGGITHGDITNHHLSNPKPFNQYIPIISIISQSYPLKISRALWEPHLNISADNPGHGTLWAPRPRLSGLQSWMPRGQYDSLSWALRSPFLCQEIEMWNYVVQNCVAHILMVNWGCVKIQVRIGPGWSWRMDGSGSPAFSYGSGVWIGLWVQGMDRSVHFDSQLWTTNMWVEHIPLLVEHVQFW